MGLRDRIKRKLLRRRSDDNSGGDTEVSMPPLCLAAYHGYVDHISTLLSDGADVAQRDSVMGESALHYAAQYGHFEAVNTLLQHGADPLLQNFSNEFTPLHYAAWNGHERIAKLLLENSADPELLDKFGRNSVDTAKEAGHHGVASLMTTWRPNIIVPSPEPPSKLKLLEAIQESDDDIGAPSTNKKADDCVICMSSPRNVALVPCGHTHFCLECASKLRKCPQCRKRIRSVLKIYI